MSRKAEIYSMKTKLLALWKFNREKWVSVLRQLHCMLFKKKGLLFVFRKKLVAAPILAKW